MLYNRPILIYNNDLILNNNWGKLQKSYYQIEASSDPYSFVIEIITSFFYFLIGVKIN